MPETSISNGKVAEIHFTLTLDDGQIADSSVGQDPMLYLHGADNIVLGLEKELVGKAAGAELKVDVSAEEGFGVRNEQGVQDVPRSSFPEDIEFELGMDFGFESEDGSVMTGWVTAFTDETVTIDLNHPLAGEALHFDVKVLSVREATPEELEHGHPHGVGGHEH
ncbi:MAG: peptidylprolyl isomerase [Planctomycetota bacterium]|nr:peptidylprolyl isomerase [Planctomycetota bacterium]